MLLAKNSTLMNQQNSTSWGKNGKFADLYLRPSGSACITPIVYDEPMENMVEQIQHGHVTQGEENIKPFLASASCLNTSKGNRVEAPGWLSR